MNTLHDPGEFAGLHLYDGGSPYPKCLCQKDGNKVTDNPILIACWAHTAWIAKATNHQENGFWATDRALKYASAWLDIVKGE